MAVAVDTPDDQVWSSNLRWNVSELRLEAGDACSRSNRLDYARGGDNHHRASNAPAGKPLAFCEGTRPPEAGIELLASMRFRGDIPQTPERRSFVCNAIKSSVAMDQHRRRS